MKTLRFLILGLLAVTTLPCLAQSSPERVQTIIPCPGVSSNGTHTAFSMDLPMGLPAGSGYAEAITPDIQALANGLQDDPVKIFKYVHDHIKFVFYYGSLKGAELTLLEQSGNDFDQCALLVALLDAAGYSPSYQYALVKMPYQATDGTQNDLQHWWGLTMPYTNSGAIYSFLDTLAGGRGYSVLDPIDSNDFGVQHVWVSLTIGGTTYLLDPAFKVSVPMTTLPGFSLTNAMGSTGTTISNALMTAAGGTDTGNYAQNLSESAVRGKLTSYTTNLLNYLQSNAPNASVEDILGGSQIVPYTNSTLSQAMVFTNLDNPFGLYPELFWTSEPTNFMSTFSVTIGTTNQTWYFPQLEGQGVSLTFDAAGTAKLWLGNSVVLQTTNTGPGPSTSVTLGAYHPFTGWNTGNNSPVDDDYFDQTMTRTYQRTNASYAIMYSFEPSVKWLNAQEQQLDIYKSEGYSNASPQVVNATLNVMGMEWMVQTKLAEDVLCQQEGVLPEFAHRVGRMAQEAGHGYYVDVYMQQDGMEAATGTNSTAIQNKNTVFDVAGYISSALEHGIIEQLQNTNLVAASTVKMLQIANTNGQPVYLATSGNWSAIRGSLINYGSTTNTFSTLISQGYLLLLPQNGSNQVAGAGSWGGDAYVQYYSSGGARQIGMIIGGGYNGGYVSSPTAVVDPVYTEFDVVNQPSYFYETPVSTPAPRGADPVDLADDTFEVENTDLSLGQAEPRGITLSRYYNGTHRFSNQAGMAGGWMHNYSVTANNIAAPEAGLGGTTPAQMASMIVTTCSILNLYNDAQPDPKNWLTTALIAKWGVDQLTKSGVSVNLGKDTLQFVQQPNGVFTPPANSTATLTQSGSAYSLQQRHGSTFKFNSSGFLTNIVDQYSQSLNLTYNASNWVSTVKDWQNRHTFTFTYSGTPQRLASVSDGTRTVSYDYSTTYNPQGDLTSFTDPEGKTSTYTYDTNHQITATLDAQSRLVVSNLYDTQGHVTTQYTQGLTNKTWLIFWSGWQTTEFDPALGETDYYYDDQGRLIGANDPLGNVTATLYDGQNHVTDTYSALGEHTKLVYDSKNNLIQKIDPLGFTNQFIYDGNNNLVKTIDPRGNASTFGYNSQFSLIGSTNGAGDFINYAFNTDGTLHTRTDSGGTTTYGYDTTYGLLNSIAYPGSLGSESFTNSSFGDVISHTDARGFATTFSYNNRRQLTNSVAPTNLVSKIAYDSVGNAISATDPSGNASSNTWSATRHLLATILPPTSSGTPVVTNIYDNRDWLISSIDPLQKTTQYTNDADGRLIAATDPLSRTTTFGYDADARKIAATNAAGEVTGQSWDARGELTTLTDAAGHTVLRAYDGAGNQITLTNRNSQKWQFQFDGANRLTNTVTPLGHSTTIAFNHQGLMTSMKDPAGQSTTYSYDGKRRLTSRADNVGTTTYNYDANDNATNTYENSFTNSWTYDAYNRISSYKDIYGNLIQYRYDVNNNLTNLVYPGGKNVYYNFDSNNHLTQVKDWSGRITTTTYDLAGRLTSITRPNGTQRIVSYDAAGQSTNIIEETPVGFPIALFRLNWNNAAEMQWEFAAPLHNTNTPATRTMTYNADNQLAMVDGNSVTVDSDGNMTSGPLTNDTFATYAFDARNRLLNVGGVTNAYDPAGNRVGQTYGTNTIAFVVNPNAKLPQVLIRIKNGVTNYYVYGVGLLYQITETASATNTLTYHYDYRGSTIALTDGNGNLTDRMEYSLYATPTYRAGTNDTPFLFNGRYGVQADPNGLLYMKARYYNPFLCRFINPDPTGFSGGLNFYAYANGNPASLLDPFGLGVWTSVFGGLRMVGGGIEATVGFTFAGATAETLVGGAAGIAVGLHGVDSFQTGFRQMISGQQATSLTSSGLQAAGMSPTAANLTDAGISIIGTAGTSIFGATPASGSLVQLTDSAGGAAINNSGTLIGEGGIYAGPLDNAGASGLGVTLRTALNPADYEAAVPIPGAAEGVFSSVQPTGIVTGWQALTGQAYTQGGVLDLTTGVFTQTGVNVGQAVFYGLDATVMNGVPAVGTYVSSSTGK